MTEITYYDGGDKKEEYSYVEKVMKVKNGLYQSWHDNGSKRKNVLMLMVNYRD